MKGDLSGIVAAQHGWLAAMRVAYAALSDEERCKFWRLPEVGRPEMAEAIEAQGATKHDQ